MTTKRLDEVRPGDWVWVDYQSSARCVTAVHYKYSGRISIDAGGRDTVAGVAEDTVDVAVAPPKITLGWNVDLQVWDLKINTEAWPGDTRLMVDLDGGILFDPDIHQESGSR